MVQHSTARDGISVPDHGVWVAALPPVRPPPPSSGGHGDLLGELRVIETPPAPQGHAGHRVLGDRHGKLGFLPEQPVQPAKEATTAGDDYARIDDIRGQFWGCLLETGAPLLSGGQWVAALKKAPAVSAQYRPAREARRRHGGLGRTP